MTVCVVKNAVFEVQNICDTTRVNHDGFLMNVVIKCLTCH